MQLTTLGRLRARVVPPAAGDAVEQVVVLLHGFGAPGDDLVALAEWIEAPGTAWVFPEAPLVLGGPYGDARAWWMIDLERLERDAAHGQLGDRSAELPDGLVEARAMITELLAAVATRFADARLVLGGFSQGAMLSCDVALHSDRPLAGLILLSGTLLARAEWAPRMPARAGLPVLMSHGRHDALLSFTAAETLRDLLIAAGLQLEWLPFDGGHEIPPPLLEAVGDFLTVLDG